jgi:hypothetical protein
LLPTPQSAWGGLYDSNEDRALNIVSGFESCAFNARHNLFKPHFDGCFPWTKENPGMKYKKS